MIHECALFRGYGGFFFTIAWKKTKVFLFKLTFYIFFIYLIINVYWLKVYVLICTCFVLYLKTMRQSLNCKKPNKETNVASISYFTLDLALIVLLISIGYRWFYFLRRAKKQVNIYSFFVFFHFKIPWHFYLFRSLMLAMVNPSLP